MRIFLSYGHDDYAALASRIQRDLMANGHDVWFDVERLRTGGDWERYLEEGFELVSRDREDGRFLLLMTPHSVRRPDGYCLNELTRAFARNLPIIPVMVADVEPPLSICRLQWLDMRSCFPVAHHEEHYSQRFGQLLAALVDKQVPFEGVQQRLLQYLQPLLHPGDVSRHLSRFTGREWVMQEVQDWLASSDRVLWLTGEPGVGKSAMAAWLCNTRAEVVAYHFCRFGNSDRVDPRKVLFSLAYQLSTQLPVYRDRLNAAPLDKIVVETNLPAIFDRLFVNLLNDAAPLTTTPHVLLIDALDEATRDGRNELATLIASEFDRLPRWLRLIVTSRPHEEAINAELQVLNAWKLDAGRSENLADIRTYLLRELRPFSRNREPSDEVVGVIVERSEGLFLYVTLVREELDKGRLSLARLEAFPQGLGGVYLHWFKRYFPDLTTYRCEALPALEAICAAREPLTREDLSAMLGWSEYAVDAFTADIGSLFPWVGERIRPVHQSVRDWLTDRRRSAAYRVDIIAGQRRLADFVVRQYRDGIESMSTYVLLHGPFHLASSGRRAELETLLLDPVWVEAKLVAADVVALLSDYDFALAGSSDAESRDLRTTRKTTGVASERLPEDADLRLVCGSLRLALPVLAAEPKHLCEQLLGRLPPGLSERLDVFRGRLLEEAPRPRFHARWPNLVGVGPLLQTLVQQSAVTGALVLPDGGVLSWSDHGTLWVWDDGGRGARAHGA